ncbi:hypothetical protein CC1G_03981 [Coprinopsis cinerea okayama7|uniref:Uncharacterized protein n=1 Tax=Coprinopsis cinerea (strain Okayama-7 / 130 / ATCC MYA-4618 / FGSC 9003) TaxID=240176 RepID=A8N8D4_COPC7|nr:hypothetical protein CC1G_03981 [Coprinopsis cinerea okayama7\|eukprot:XP_001831090.1 hypothetical protein CC1G_03981 [Coprinopsis cinerea okayama7\
MEPVPPLEATIVEVVEDDVGPDSAGENQDVQQEQEQEQIQGQDQGQTQEPVQAPQTRASNEDTGPPPRIDGPLQTFFDRFLPNFIFDPRNPSYDEYHRLEAFRKQTNHPSLATTTRKALLEEFRIALIEQFHFRFGRDVESLDAWRALCVAMKIEPVPDTLKEARKAVFNTHVNLVDLTDEYEDWGRLTKFSSEAELSDYTLRTKYIFPRNKINRRTILYMLLRRIYFPPPVGTVRNERNRLVIPGSAPREEGGPKQKRGRRGARRRKGSRRTDSSDVPVNNPETGGQP